MADIDSRPRKSVAFAEGETIVDSNGEVSQQAAPEGEKDTAESHSKPDGAVDEATDDFAALALGAKKKKKKSKKEDEGENGEAEGDDGEVDLTAGGDEEKVMADDAAEKESAKAETGLQEGDLIQGTGIWAHDETKPINYESLLSRFFSMLADSHPDLGGGGMKSYKIPPPQCLREGNKKTIFANIAEICKRMKRTDEHVTQFLFAELGTSGSVDGSRRLVIKGRFQQKQIENVLRRYIVEYVTCKTCRSPDTELNKGENRLYFVTCNSCGSRRSVTAIKTGFSAQYPSKAKSTAQRRMVLITAPSYKLYAQSLHNLAWLEYCKTLRRNPRRQPSLFPTRFRAPMLSSDSPKCILGTWRLRGYGDGRDAFHCVDISDSRAYAVQRTNHSSRYFVLFPQSFSLPKGRSSRPSHLPNYDQPSQETQTKRRVRFKSPTPSSSDNDDEEDSPCRCICGDNDSNAKRPWTQCTACSAWQHNDCMDVSVFDDELGDHYWCEVCAPEKHVELLDAVAGGEKLWEATVESRERLEEFEGRIRDAVEGVEWFWESYQPQPTAVAGDEGAIPVKLVAPAAYIEAVQRGLRVLFDDSPMQMLRDLAEGLDLGDGRLLILRLLRRKAALVYDESEARVLGVLAEVFGWVEKGRLVND
ncbi:hypothetical protein Q7P37_002252 [Cladosporium fusiforme]